MRVPLQKRRLYLPLALASRSDRVFPRFLRLLEVAFEAARDVHTASAKLSPHWLCSMISSASRRAGFSLNPIGLGTSHLARASALVGVSTSSGRAFILLTSSTNARLALCALIGLRQARRMVQPWGATKGVARDWSSFE